MSELVYKKHIDINSIIKILMFFSGALINTIIAGQAEFLAAAIIFYLIGRGAVYYLTPPCNFKVMFSN